MALVLGVNELTIGDPVLPLVLVCENVETYDDDIDNVTEIVEDNDGVREVVCEKDICVETVPPSEADEEMVRVDTREFDVFSENEAWFEFELDPVIELVTLDEEVVEGDLEASSDTVP